MAASVGLTITHEASPEIKKPDAPLARCVGSRQEPAHRTSEKRPARHNDTMGLCWYFDSMSKGQIKLGGFYTSFAEITDENELEIRFRWQTEPESADNLSPCHEKVKPQSGAILIFFRIFPSPGPSRCTCGKPVRETEPISPFWSRTHENLRFQMMSLSQLGFFCVTQDCNTQSSDILSII